VSRGRPLGLLAATVGLAVLLVGCGGSDQGEGTEPTSRVGTTSTVTSAPDATGPSTTVPVTTVPTTTVSASPSTSAPLPGSLAGVVVVVDPGHNGRNGSHAAEISKPVDAGGFDKPCNTVGAAPVDGVTESRLTFEIGLRTKAALERAGATVVLTRADDDGWGPCVDQRGLMAQQHGAAVLVSIHVDGAAGEAHGFHVIRPGLVKGYTDAVVAPSTVLAALLRDELVGHGMTPSTYLGVDGIDERTDLGTLNRSGVPSVMVECGNLDNRGDRSVLTSAEGQDRVAQSIAAAVERFHHAG